MIIRLKGDNPSLPEIWSALNFALNRRSRFTAEIESEPRGFKITTVRLRKSKPYCGSHPNSCEFGGAHKRHVYLEGADWVEFNDLLNDVLDKLHVSARVFSTVVTLRKGKMRRTAYRSTFTMFGPVGQWIWDRDADAADYTDYCGRTAPASEFPHGTPGIYSRVNYEVAA